VRLRPCDSFDHAAFETSRTVIRKGGGTASRRTRENKAGNTTPAARQPSYRSAGRARQCGNCEEQQAKNDTQRQQQKQQQTLLHQQQTLLHQQQALLHQQTRDGSSRFGRVSSSKLAIDSFMRLCCAVCRITRSNLTEQGWGRSGWGGAIFTTRTRMFHRLQTNAECSSGTPDCLAWVKR